MEKIITGNDFRLIVDAQKMENRASRFDLNQLERCEIYLVKAGRARILQSYTLDDVGRAIIDVDGDALTTGTWGVEIVGTYLMASVRSTNAKAFQIVDGLNNGGMSGDGLLITVEVLILANSEATRPYVDYAIAEHDADTAAHPTLQAAIDDKVADVKINGTSVVDDGKVANVTMPTKVSDLDNDSEYTTKTYVDAQVSSAGRVDDVEVNGTSVLDGKTAKITMPTKTSDLSNDSDFATNASVDAKVATAGHVDDVQVNGASVVSGKVANVAVPTKVSDITNDSGFQNATQVQQAVDDAIAANLITGANVTIDSNTGTPTATVTKNGNSIDFEFKNLKGEPFTYEDFTPQQLARLVGPKGGQGDSAIWTGEGELWSGLKNTTGQSTTEPMTQKAVTDEFDKFKEKPYDMASVAWEPGGITTSGYESGEVYKKANKRSNEISFDVSTYDKVRVAAPNNKLRFAVYSIEGNRPNRVFSCVSEDRGGYIFGPDEYYFTPESGKVYVLRISGPNGTEAEMNALVASDYPVITLYNKSYTHIIDDVNDRLGEIEEPLIEETIVPVYSYGGITTTSGVYYTVYTDKITPLISFDTSIVEKVVVHRRGTEVKFALYQISDNGTITLLSYSFVTEDYEFTPQDGYSYLIRFVPASGKSTKEVMDSIPKSSYPVFKVTYKTSSVKIKDAEDMMKAKNYTYRRNYANITGLLEFENKTISTSGITDNASTLLAKIPNVGCVEVKMNTPLGGFSVWKKVGNTITCLQEYTHAQYRFAGDYSSEYYVLVQAESGNAGVNIVAVYTYSDEGVVSKYEAPSWAKGKKIAFLGDSIVQGRYPKNGSSVNIAMDKPWPNLVAEALGTEDFTNFAIGGALIHDSSWRSIAAMAANVQDYDVVFVCGGTNDYGNKTSKANFESTYSSMLATLIQNNAMVIPMTPVYRTRTVSSPIMPLSGYVQSIMQIAKDETIPAVPMYDLTNTSDFIAHLVDGLHPDETGQRIIAETILEWISKNIQ